MALQKHSQPFPVSRRTTLGALSGALLAACTIASNILVEPPWIATAIATKFTKIKKPARN